MEQYDVIVVGSGAAGVFLAYEMTKVDNRARVLVLEKGTPLEQRICPIKVTEGKCMNCRTCSIMNGYGGAGTLSDGKYNITTQFGGDLHKYVGTDQAMELMEYVDDINMRFGGSGTILGPIDICAN